MLSALQLLAGVASVVCKLLEYPLPAKLWGTPGAQQGGGIPKDQLGLHLPPGLTWGPSNVFLLYKNQVQVLPPLPSGSQTAPLFFRAADCESQSLKREAKYIPLVNEEINLFKSCPGGSYSEVALRGRAPRVTAPVLTCLRTSPGPGPGPHHQEPRPQPHTIPVCSELRNSTAREQSRAQPGPHSPGCTCYGRTSR